MSNTSTAIILLALCAMFSLAAMHGMKQDQLLARIQQEYVR